MTDPVPQPRASFALFTFSSIALRPDADKAAALSPFKIWAKALRFVLR
jgi:hypothetical protein